MKKLLVSVIALLATVSLSAQDLTAVYNEAAAAFGNKDFAGAAAKFEEVIDKGMDDETAASLVAIAKTTLPKCYFMLGGSALKTKNYEEALKNFTKSAELAELYGDFRQGLRRRPRQYGHGAQSGDELLRNGDEQRRHGTV